jgi:hypothetical protein
VLQHDLHTFCKTDGWPAATSLLVVAAGASLDDLLMAAGDAGKRGTVQVSMVAGGAAEFPGVSGDGRHFTGPATCPTQKQPKRCWCFSRRHHL